MQFSMQLVATTSLLQITKKITFVLIIMEFWFIEITDKVYYFNYLFMEIKNFHDLKYNHNERLKDFIFEGFTNMWIVHRCFIRSLFSFALGEG